MLTSLRAAAPHQAVVSHHTTAPTEALAIRASRGDEEAMAALYDRYLRQTYRYVLARVGGEHHVAEDVTADAWLAVVRAIGGYQRRESSGGWVAWLYTVIRSRIADHHRGQTHRREFTLTSDMLALFDQPADCDDPAAAALAAEASESLMATVTALPKGQSDVLIARFWMEMTVAETAELLGRTPGSVKVTQHRALKALREALAGKA